MLLMTSIRTVLTKNVASAQLTFALLEWFVAGAIVGTGLGVLFGLSVWQGAAPGLGVGAYTVLLLWRARKALAA